MATMTLYAGGLSPYGRKVRMTAYIKGVMGDIDEKPADTNKGDDALNAHNPLGKIPCLVLADGAAVYDSAVICEYLDTLGAKPVLFPAFAANGGRDRLRVLTQGALGDGILDAALLLVYEKRFRPENMAVQSWIDRQQARIDRAVALLDKAPPAFGGTPDYGTVTIAAAIGYLDFRHEGKWRAKAPALVKWLDGFDRSVPAFGKTRPVA